MKPPIVSRPHFPQGYLVSPTVLLAWAEVEQRLAAAHNYWFCSVSPEGQPHAVPKWGVYVDGKIYVDGSPQTRHFRNVMVNPRVTVHLESGDQPIIVSGRCRAVGKPPADTAAAVAHAYCAKYSADGYAPEPAQWDVEGLYEVILESVFAWTKFTDDPTKFSFEA
jgi:nitroimidazol reductase NimA-like FMN-containing flavoprotein (pyridoxamine 5'-phosphate oxidase superfamily)